MQQAQVTQSGTVAAPAGLAAIVSALALDGQPGQGDVLAVLAEEWPPSRATLPADGPFFLRPAFVARAARAAYLQEEVVQAAVTAARRVAADPLLAALAWHCRRCLFDVPAYPRDLVWRWPLLAGPLDRDAGLFYLLVLLANAPSLQRLYRARAIPERVARDTLYDIDRRLLEHREAHGHWGLTPRHLTWLRLHLAGSIYHLVRLQFAPGPLHAEARFFRHRTTGAVLALAEDGTRYRAGGALDGAGGVADPDGAWTARLTVGEHEIVGFPIAPVGRALRREVRLRRPDWQPALATGDPVLQLHIPAGSPMDFDRCGESFRAALEFFPRHFPDRPFAAFACSSWLLDPQLGRLLPPTSNIVRLQREVYLLPGRSDGRTTLVRVFGAAADDLARAPRDTTLRRALLDHLQAGGHLSSGKCVLLPQDLRWGSQAYRRQTWPPELAALTGPLADPAIQTDPTSQGETPCSSS